MLFQVLGPVAARDGDGRAIELGPGKPVLVLAGLLLRAGDWVPVDELIDTTWAGRRPPPSAEANLKTYIWRLRRVLPADGPESRIEHRPGAYRIRVAAAELDARLAADLAAAAEDALAAGDAAEAAVLAERGLALWRGRPYEGVSGTSVATAHLDDLRRHLRETLARTRLAADRPADAVASLRTLTAEDPLRETTWALLVDALVAAGRRGEALAAFSTARRVLTVELGIDPGPALLAAHERALAGPPPPIPFGARRELPRAVYGFAGREAELADLGEVVSAPVRVAVVEGMPRIGKSALVVHLAHRLAEEFPDGQFHVDLRHGAATPAEVLDRLLRATGVAEVPAGTGERAALWRSRVARRRILLVLDDAADEEQVAPLLPAGDTALTLITTRTGDWHVPGARRLRLGPLPAAASEELLRAADGHGRLDAEPEALRALLELCAGLPALVRAAADRLAVRPLWSLADVVAWLDGELGRGGGCVTALAASVRRRAAAERKVLALGDADPQRVSRRLRIRPLDARRLLERLVDANLAGAPVAGHYTVHPVLRRLAGGPPDRRGACVA
ncbi:BTAD domain-containing putative transcriptional regulator [Amycolatopsis sp. cmx-4-83]|uniref:AfsR/SARP family transcriptional regulator n=1 Tax=Amycolatopsis sp. cmx-4-83 TaxID=2790940 RepID=UPI00397D3741